MEVRHELNSIRVVNQRDMRGPFKRVSKVSCSIYSHMSLM